MKEKEYINNLNLELMMEKRGYDAAALEYKSGIDATKIVKYIRGGKDINRASAYTAYKLAKALKCRVGDILNLEDARR